MKWILLSVSIFVFNTIALLMKKRLTLSEIYTTVIFALFVDVLADTFASFRFHAWGFFEMNKVEFSALLVIFGIYPAISSMIINWYPFQSIWWLKICYLVGWAVFSTTYEWMCLKTGVIWHMNWNLPSSFVLYIFIYYIFLIVPLKFYRFLKHIDSI